MELEDAIKHAKEVGMEMVTKCDTMECGRQHLQLAKWLEELQAFRKKYGKLPKDNLFIS